MTIIKVEILRTNSNLDRLNEIYFNQRFNLANSALEYKIYEWFEQVLDGHCESLYFNSCIDYVIEKLNELKLDYNIHHTKRVTHEKK